MDVMQMHIEVEQATQMVAANKRRKLFPEEIDWILNKVMLRYIGTHASSIRENPSAEDSLVHLNRISGLLDRDTLPVFKAEDGLLSAPLPYIICEVLSAEPRVANLCGNAPSAFTDFQTLHILKIPLTNATSNWYKNVTVTIDGVEVFNIQKFATDRNKVFNGMESRDMLWKLYAMIMVELSNADMDVHWEMYDGDVWPRSIIFSDLGSPKTINLTIDGDTTTAQVKEKKVTRYTEQYGKLTPGRLYMQTTMPTVKASAFGRTHYRSPMCFYDLDVLNIQGDDKSFTVREVKVHYVRTPRTIDVNLGQDCELPDNVHPDICDLATEYIKALRADPDWEMKLRDNMTRSTI